MPKQVTKHTSRKASEAATYLSEVAELTGVELPEGMTAYLKAVDERAREIVEARKRNAGQKAGISGQIHNLKMRVQERLDSEPDPAEAGAHAYGQWADNLARQAAALRMKGLRVGETYQEVKDAQERLTAYEEWVADQAA